MEHASTLIVLTLLQLCRAEISEIIPGTWFSANAINDEYSPKPILDLFSTEPNAGFSPTKPIVVLPTQQSLQPEPEVTHFSSTPQPPLSTPQTTYRTTYVSSTPFPSTASSYSPSTFFPSTNLVTTPYPPPENLPNFNFPTGPAISSNAQTTLNQNEDISQTPTYDIGPNTESTLPPILQPQTPPTPYLVIYQNPPQSSSFAEQSITETTSKAPIQFSSGRPTQQTNAPFITNSFSDGTSRPTVTFRSTPPTISTTANLKTTLLTIPTRAGCDPAIKVSNPTTGSPPKILPGPPDGPFLPKLKIRVVAPKGSITNIKINPSTTTKRPSTRKMKVKKLRNTHTVCVDNCKGKKEPICAIPLGSLVVEPRTLKGFPSICHMACHNSFKKEPYEKIIDGRCGRIRTKFIRVETNSKIHREELKKSEYSIINNGPQTVVELAGAQLLDARNRKN